jgi:hypothetical protein
MSPLVRSMRRKLLGETRTIPLGVAAAIVLALLLEAVLPRGEWRWIGGFAFASVLITTLMLALYPKTPRRHR